MILLILAVLLNYKTYSVRKFRLLPITGEKIKNYGEYSVSFNTTLTLPNYSMYVINSTHRCHKSFWKDKDLGTRSSHAFNNTGYDRGHQCAAVDIQDCPSTFSMGNVAPQIHPFNSLIWDHVEQYFRDTYNNTLIFTSPEYGDHYILDYYGKLMNIPTGFFKIAVRGNEILYSIYLPHKESIVHEDFKKVGDFNRLPYFMQLI